MPNLFNNVSKLHPGRSVFDLSYEKKFNCDMGQLIPVMCDEVVPGDKFKISNEIVIRWQPLIKPILHEVNVYTHYFFVPYRLLWDEWEDFITGGADGTLEPTLPTWVVGGAQNGEGTLWDYLGFPINVIPAGSYPSLFPLNAYNLIWDEYYRDQTLQAEITPNNTAIQFRAWTKDYFTSALPWQQRNPIAPSLPIVGTTTAVFDSGNVIDLPGTRALELDNTTNPLVYTQDADGKTAFTGFLAGNTVDLSAASSFDIADLREVVQIQKFLERNARVGARYTEFLGAHFGVSPKDSRLDRPEYIGGTKSPVIISEVLQTSTSGSDVFVSDTAQGNLAGHGITADRNMVGSYRAEEFGLIMGIMSVMPKPAYQQGIGRQWLRETKYDFYFPEFAHLSEQPISQAEIYASDTQLENNTLFGYQGKYDEMRVKKNMICGTLRSSAVVSLEYWHLARNFATAPILDETFITTGDPTRVGGFPPSGTFIRKDIFAVKDEYGLIVNYANKIKAIRPMPAASNPGLMDHF
nr:MAG: major capsid protein [Microvirus sp.]